MTSELPGALPLAVEGVMKRFGDVHALRGVTLEVRAGERLALLGPNGAGKTTLIRAIAGRTPADAGTIRVFGRVLTRDDPRADIGVVPQEAAIYPRLTARENLEVFGRLYGVSAADLTSRVQWALEWSDLAGRANEPTIRFSGGMKRRLNIACSLLHRPRLVLLDEPTAGVDPQSRERIYEMLDALRRDGVSVVLTTHHLEEAESRCERIVIIDHGAVAAAGTLSELVARTLGPDRTVTVALGSSFPDGAAVPAGAVLADDRRVLRLAVRDIGPDLSGLLRGLSVAGVPVTDLALTGASLQDVFIALTGRELRE